VSDWAVCLARSNTDVPKRAGITYFLVDLHAQGVTVRPLRHLGGEVDFNEVFLDEVRVPDFHRVGGAGEGWRVAGATLAGERKMVSGSGSGGVDRIGGSGVERLIERARALARHTDPVVRQRLTSLYTEERVRSWTNARARGTPGPATSIGKIHQGELNQRIQDLAVDVLRMDGTAFAAAGGGGEWATSLPFEVRGMLRSLANTIEGGTTEVNKNIVGEKVLGLPREPDPWSGAAWQDIPRS
jgi:alkylation response protein AidB-like acyl-CoA dehydrogenase